MPQRYRLPDETTRPRGSHFRKFEQLNPHFRVGVRVLGEVQKLLEGGWRLRREAFGPGVLANGLKASDSESDGSGFTHLHRRDASHPLLGAKPIWGIPLSCVTLWDGMWCRRGPGEARTRCFLYCYLRVAHGVRVAPPSVARTLGNPMFCFGCTETKPNLVCSRSILDFLQRLIRVTKLLLPVGFPKTKTGFRDRNPPFFPSSESGKFW